MLATFHFLAEQVFGDSYLELLTLAVLVSGFLGAYRHLKCHRSGCRRLGRFTHGHMKLCALHHPLVPSDGRIGQQEIDAVRSPGAPASAAAGGGAHAGTSAGGHGAAPGGHGAAPS